MSGDITVKNNTLRCFLKATTICLALALGGCASVGNLSLNSAEKTQETIRSSEGYVESFSNVNANTIAQNLNKSTFKIGDVADVSVYNVEALSNTYVVDGFGNISFPLIGSVKVEGLSTTQLQQTLTDRYGSKYLREPGINVKLETTDLGRIVVDGSVNSPGVFEIKEIIRLTEAIALAEGLDNIETNGSVVYIARNINGERKVTEVDLRSIRKFAIADPQIIPNDVVFVQDNAGRIVFREFLRTVPLLNTVAIFATR